MGQDGKVKVFDYVIAGPKYYNQFRAQTNGQFIVGPHETLCCGDNMVAEDVKVEF